MSGKNSFYKHAHKKNLEHEKLAVVYEDKWLVVVEKPSGMLTVSYNGSRVRTAQNVLEQIMRKSGTYTSRHRPFVVHRLDRDTSGVMMFALTELAQKKIMGDWQNIVTERDYIAVAENSIHALDDNGVIEDALAYNAYNLAFVPRDGERFKTIKARTYYKVIARGETHTMVKLSLETGRKNQIRAHLASRGCPISGDKNYKAKTNPFGRLALHARTLAFVHPFTGEQMRFEIPEPGNWIDFVKHKKNRRGSVDDFGL